MAVLQFVISIIGVMSIMLLATSIIRVEGNSDYHYLTPEERYVIIDGGTELPNSGVYVNNFEGGIYTCKQCGAPLFRSETKFRSHCGWPSFDQAIEGAVHMETDDDGVRTEIVCASCGGHLGHVFTGEGYTETDTRFCVNSISMNFVPNEYIETAYFAGGCFWGVEYTFDNTPGVIYAESGYMGGNRTHPNYSDVCTGTTGHAETVKVVFDSRETSFKELATIFFEIHDPTQLDRQGVDTGNQYRSAVFYTNEEQLSTTNELIAALEENGYSVTTEVSAAGDFWPAEDYHQNYIHNHSAGRFCHTRVSRFNDE